MWPMPREAGPSSDSSRVYPTLRRSYERLGIGTAKPIRARLMQARYGDGSWAGSCLWTPCAELGGLPRVRTKDLPADDLQAVDFQVLDRCIARDKSHAKSFGVGCSHDVKCSRASTEALGRGTNSGMSLGSLLIPWMNRYPREERTTAAMTDRLSSRRRAP